MKLEKIVSISILLIYMMASGSKEPREVETGDIHADSDEKALNSLTAAFDYEKVLKGNMVLRDYGNPIAFKIFKSGVFEALINEI